MNGPLGSVSPACAGTVPTIGQGPEGSKRGLRRSRSDRPTAAPVTRFSAAAFRLGLFDQAEERTDAASLRACCISDAVHIDGNVATSHLVDGVLILFSPVTINRPDFNPRSDSLP